MDQDQDLKNKLTIKAVGDIAAGDYSIHGLGICSLTKKHGCDYPFEKLNGIFSDTDLLLGNLEGPLSNKSLTQDLRLCGQPDMATSLKKIGFDVLSLANNHIFDHGVDVFNETVEYCKEAGIEICGLRGKGDYYCEPVIIEKNSCTIGILAYNWVGLEDADDKIGEYIAAIEDGVINYTWNRNKEKDIESRRVIHTKNKAVLSDIFELRKEVDVLILMPHWGYEWSNYPPYGVVLEAHTFIDAGVDLIMGSHPHVIQGIEEYNNGLIAYSLGNFLFDFSTNKYVSGMLLENELVDGKLRDYKSRIIFWNENYQPEEVFGSRREKYIEIVEQSSKAIKSEDSVEKLDDELIYKEYEKKYNDLKLLKVVFLLKKLPTNPFLIKPILRKSATFVQLLVLRLKGKKIRW